MWRQVVDHAERVQQPQREPLVRQLRGLLESVERGWSLFCSAAARMSATLLAKFIGVPRPKR